MQENNPNPPDSSKEFPSETLTPVTDLPRQKDIDKEIKAKTKELKTLGKEMKSRNKKRSGIVISEEMTQIADDVVVLNEQPTQ
jgi:hypothetical protein